MALTFIGGAAYGQRVVPKKQYVKKHAKSKIARAAARRRHRKAARPAVPPREVIKYTIAGPLPNYRGDTSNGTDNTSPPAYRGPVGGSPGTGPNQISGGVLNGKAIALPKPAYPAAARAVRASGPVTVQVLIDEEGNVISASAVSGNPLLRAAAVQAARGAKFSPTRLSGQPVKVSGVVVYNFVP
jgi:TonB family protein